VLLLFDGLSSNTNKGSAVGIPGSWSCAASVALRLLTEKGGLVTARSAAAIVYVSQGCLEQTETKGLTGLNAATA
jgi:anthranilate/para-aminobenzoate synthase component I